MSETLIVRTCLFGLGNVNRNLMQILLDKEDRLRSQYGVAFKVVCIADSSGVAVYLEGFDLASVLSDKKSGVSVSQMRGFHNELTVYQVISELDLLMEGSPVDLHTGAPGLGVVRACLTAGVSVVLANKAPLVLEYAELHQLALSSGARLLFSATVCGGLPVLNVGRRDLVAADVSLIRGVFNSTCNHILGQMEQRVPFQEALQEAQSRGIAEADPMLDITGCDTANKLLIVANTVLGMQARLQDVSVRGITEVSMEHVVSEMRRGFRVKLVGQCIQGKLSVQPVSVPQADFLAQAHGWEMALEIHSDIYGKMYMKLYEREPIPTAASMLRDAVHIFVKGSSQ